MLQLEAIMRLLSVFTLCLAATLVACGSPGAKEREVNPLAVAEDYARKHYPNRFPEGLGRQWHVQDHGDIWTVELSHQGMVGGGIKMGIRKQDGTVVGAELTQ